jgi:predicted Fe-Mo cluster-binding NifX family protein
MNSGPLPLLCPFFDKCDGVLMHNAMDGSTEFHPHDRSDGKSMCDLVLKLKADRMICGFIGGPEMQRLRSAGIDVRLGPCNCPVDELLSSFATLPSV